MGDEIRWSHDRKYPIIALPAQNEEKRVSNTLFHAIDFFVTASQAVFLTAIQPLLLAAIEPHQGEAFNVYALLFLK